MLKGLLGSRRWPLGLDIGTATVRMLQLHRSGRNLTVVASGQHDLPPRLPRTGPEYRQAVTAAVREMLRKGGFRGRRVVSALSCNDMVMKNVRMPAMSDREFVEAVRWEAGERFPFSPGSDQLRWIKAGQIRQGAEVREEVIMLAARPEAVENHLAMLEEVGLVPEHIEAEPLALFRVFTHFLRRRADEQAVNVVADIGRSSTRITVARGRRVVFLKQIDIGGQQFTEAVAKQLNLDESEAAELRLRIMRDSAASAPNAGRGEDVSGAEPPAGDKDWTLRDAIRGPAEDLAREVALCLRYCSVTFRGLRPDRLVLTGGESHDPALMEILSRNLGVECVVGEPLRGVDLTGMAEAAAGRERLAGWAVCAGLAMRDIDFENAGEEGRHVERRLSA